MKKILILTVSTGQGHNQAAASLETSFVSNGYEVIKNDFLSSSSKFLNDMIVMGYELMASKLPKTYGLFYKFTDSKLINKLLKVPFCFSKKKVLKLINEANPDVIIATHALSINVIEDLKKNNLINIPYISIVTDFKAHYTYISQYVDAYITGSDYTKNSLIARGINSNKIFPIGIPINQKFYTEITNADKLKDNEYFNLLLMSGSLGLNTIFLVLKELLKNKHKLRITVVCGKNTHLKDKLTKYCHLNEFKDKKLHIIGFTKDISYLMDYCDIIISKPGGLTVTESIVKNIPLIIPFAIPGQEEENMDFLTNEGYSVSIKDLSSLNKVIDNLISNPSSLNNLKYKLKKLSSTYSLDKIVDITEELIKKYTI